MEKKPGKSQDAGPDTAIDPLAITSAPKAKMIKPSEVTVERDPETGKILRVIRPDDSKTNPLNDPLNELSPEPESRPTASKQSKGIVAELEAQVLAEEQHLARTKRPRQQSQREEEWIQRLVEVHGDNYRAMFRDKKLNPMQQSEGDIKRRVQKWVKKHANE